MNSSSSSFLCYKMPKKTVLWYKSGSIEIREPDVQKVSSFFACKSMYASMPTGNSSGNNHIFLLKLD